MIIHITDMLSFVEQRFVQSETPVVETSVWLHAFIDGVEYQGTAKVTVPLTRSDAKVEEGVLALDCARKKIGAK